MQEDTSQAKLEIKLAFRCKKTKTKQNKTYSLQLSIQENFYTTRLVHVKVKKKN